MNSQIVLCLALACLSMAIAVPVDGDSPACPCPRNYDPLCANDGVSYSNQCVFDCKRNYLQRTTGFKLEVFHKGLCAVPFIFEKQPACLCPKNMEPVCANDGKTYDNECMFNCERDFKQKRGVKLEIVLKDSCENKATKLRPACPCPFILEPLCANDGTTYDNECAFECERNYLQRSSGFNLAISHKGGCIVPLTIELNPPACLCPKNMEPVCANDGKTYDNECMFNCERDFKQKRGVKLEIVLKDSCENKATKLRPVCACPFNLEPLCANDGTTYDNKCAFECEQKYLKRSSGFDLKVSHEGVCIVPFSIELNLPACVCPKNMEPVCANDGKTYDNECMFNCERDFKQKRGVKLEIVLKDSCENKLSDVRPVCACPFILEPLCANDGTTYENKCTFECEKNFMQRTSGFKLEVFHQGHCAVPLAAKEEQPMCVCPRIMAPLCANDGVTYDNECLFKCERDFKQRTTGFNLEVFHQGYCAVPVVAKEEHPMCVCPRIMAPLCANDGVTYDNECLFKCERDFKQRTTGFNLKVFHQGYCAVPVVAKEEHPMCVCPRIMAPLCANDGVTYDNECLFKCERDFKQRTTGFNLKVFHQGYCAVPVVA